MKQYICNSLQRCTVFMGCFGKRLCISNTFSSPLGVAEADDMAKDGVRDFLRFNRDFLEDIIIQEVPQETLERILIRKAALKSSFEESNGIHMHTCRSVCQSLNKSYFMLV